MGNLNIGDQSLNGQITIIDEDRLCYIVRSVSRGAEGLRTISKRLLQEFVDYRRSHPSCTPNEARDALKGRSDIDNFEYGYNYTLLPMADMVLGKKKATTKASVERSKKEHDITNRQVIYYGAPGTGKSHAIKEQTEGKHVIRTTFHPDSDYSTFVGAYKPTTKEVFVRDSTGRVVEESGEKVVEDRIVYEFVSQAFLQAYVNAWRAYAKEENGEAEKQYLIIEEINRGNCAQIFGDLFQLLDRNDYGYSEYPITADKDMEKYLSQAFEDIAIPNEDAIARIYKDPFAAQKISLGQVLVLPPNLYIWATMNTSDQSLFPIDSAFKRRWDWKYVPISEAVDNTTHEPLGWKIHVGGKDYDWWSFLQAINKEIGELTNSQDKKLGYFFCKAKDGKISSETFVDKVLFFLWNEVLKDFEPTQQFLDDGNGGYLAFDQFYKVNEFGKTEIEEDKVVKLLDNLGVSSEDGEEDEETDEDDDINGSNGRDYTRYSINGEGSFSKRGLAVRLVEKYIQENPTMTAEDVIRRWKPVGNAIKKVQHFIESETEYNERRAKSNDNNPRAERVQCSDAPVYISTLGWGGTDSIQNLKHAIDGQFPAWNVQIEEVGE